MLTYINPVALSCLLVLLVCPLQAQADDKPTLPMDQVVLKMNTEDWATTQSAEVIVGIDATLSVADLAKAREQIMGVLKGIAPVEWHITRFQRSQDQSGLEHLQATAQARVPEAGLVNVFAKAKMATKPGNAYRIDAVNFTPSYEEVEALKARLRSRLYVDVKEELARINKIYDNQQYRVHRIDFVMQRLPGSKLQGKRLMMAEQAPASATLAVSQKIQVTALVTLATKKNKSD